MYELPRTRTSALFRNWLPVLLWLGLIAVESTEWLSAGNTGEALYWLVRQVLGPINRHPVQVVHDALRELGHFLGYGILGVLVFRALRVTFVGAHRLRWAILSLILTCGVASMDEWHQTFLPSRQGRVRDVVLDTCGAVFLLIVAFAIERLRRGTTSSRWSEGQ